MCLKCARRLKQEGEITCYKVLVRIKSLVEDVYYYFSPYNTMMWDIGNSKMARFKNGTTLETIVSENNELNSGAFHTIKTLSDAREYRAYLSGRIEMGGNSKLCIAECVIPEDNEYVYGGVTRIVDECYHNEDLESFASQKLKVVKIIGD